MKIFAHAAVALGLLYQGSCKESGGSKDAQTCGGFPTWSAEQDVRSGELYDFNGTPYQASADSRGHSPLDNPTLWNAAPCDPVKAAELKADAWRLVWEEEFDGLELDKSKWSYEVQKPGWVNHEWQNYTDQRAENVRVENDLLTIEARRDNFEGHEFSSGRIKTQGKAFWKNGRMEARIKLPYGVGGWPAFWMMPEDQKRGWPACGEIDIMEQVGFEPNMIHANLHSKVHNWKNGNSRGASTGIVSATSEFHIYAIDWFPDHIEMFVDGRRYFSASNKGEGDDVWPFDKSFHIILNLAIGGDWGGARGVDRTIASRQMQVDYVRVYQK